MATTRRPVAAMRSATPGATQFVKLSAAKPWCSTTGTVPYSAPHSRNAMVVPSNDVKVSTTPPANRRATLAVRPGAREATGGAQQVIAPVERSGAQRVEIDGGAAAVAHHDPSVDDDVLHRAAVGGPHELAHRVGGRRQPLRAGGLVDAELGPPPGCDDPEEVALADRRGPRRRGQRQRVRRGERRRVTGAVA